MRYEARIEGKGRERVFNKKMKKKESEYKTILKSQFIGVEIEMIYPLTALSSSELKLLLLNSFPFISFSSYPSVALPSFKKPVGVRTIYIYIKKQKRPYYFGYKEG